MSRLAHLRWVFVGGLIFLAAWLRLRYPGYSQVWQDQALTLNAALEWVHGGALPLASLKSSVGLYNPPLVEYLFALPLFFKPDILGVVWLVALANLLGLLAAGWATARVFGGRVAWWATLLYAVNPWAVYYSRVIWMQSFVPAFASVCYACVLLYFVADSRPAYLVLGTLALAATIQAHLTAVVLIPVLWLIGLCFWRRLRLGPVVIGAGLFILSFAPYILFEFRNRFVDWAALRAGLGGTPEVNLAPMLLLLDLLQSKGIYATLGSAGDRWRALDLLWLHADTGVAILLGLAVATVATSAITGRRAAGPRAAGQLILLIWLIMPVLAFIRHTQYLQNYYFLYLFPVPFVLLALVVEHGYTWLVRASDRLGRRDDRQAGRWAAAAVFLPLALIAYQQARLNVIGQDLLVAGASGGERVLDVRRAIDAARRLLAARPGCQLVVMSEGAEYESSRLALLREFVGSDRVRFVQAGVGYLLPAPCALYFLVTDNVPAWTWLNAIARPLPDEAIRTPEQTWTFYDLNQASRHEVLAKLMPGGLHAEWANGVQLSGVVVQGEQRAGSTLTVRATWAVTRAVSPHPVHFGTYLLTSDNKLVAQADGPGVASTEWRPGDVFQTAFQLSLPSDLAAGSYFLATALYLYPEVERLVLADQQGDLLFLDELSIIAP